jgi:hypothetical protein
MYICKRAELDLIDMDLDSDSPKSDEDQWWRIHYAPVGSSPVTVEVLVSSILMSCNADLIRKLQKKRS